jgi:hypothetical protein
LNSSCTGKLTAHVKKSKWGYHIMDVKALTGTQPVEWSVTEFAALSGGWLWQPDSGYRIHWLSDNFEALSYTGSGAGAGDRQILCSSAQTSANRDLDTGGRVFFRS